MKKNICILLSLLFLIPTYTKADNLILRFWYNLDHSNLTAELVSAYPHYLGPYNNLDVVEIPEKISFNDTEYTVVSIGEAALANTSMTKIILPKSIKRIKDKAFKGSTYLNTVEIKDLSSWLNIEFEGFNSNPCCYATHFLLNGEEIVNIEIPEGITEIKDRTFEGIKQIRSISIPNSVTVIGKYAFSNCKNVSSIIIPNSVKTIGKGAFEFCEGLTSVSIPNSVSTIEESAFAYCSALTSINLPENLTSISKGTFSDCKALSFVSIPNSVCSIGGEAFSFCSALSSIKLPENITSINNGTFEGCTALTSIIIPEKVTTIESDAFAWCNNMTSVSIPSCIESIWSKAFYGCNSIKEFYCYADEVPTISNDAFNSDYSQSILYVPNGTSDKYKANNTWNSFGNIIEMAQNKYNLNYYVDNQLYKSYKIKIGTPITPEAAPTREGYTFSGWSEIPETMPANDVTVTGTFTINKYKLTYMLDGEVYKTFEIEYDATITPEVAPTKEGYTFSGWSEIPEKMPAKDVTITGTFSKGSFKLTYLVDGEVYKTVNYDYGANITPEAAPTKEGHTFSGWSEIPETMPANDVTVTGTFTINKYKMIYKIDGEVYKTYEIEYGKAITPEAAPTKEGYTFSGWSEIPETMPANDVTVTGTFTINKYKLTYMVDGTEYKSYEIEYGAKITPEAEPTKEGYSFSGWSTIPETMPAKDFIVTGTFTKGAYKLTYMVDGEVYKTYEIEYGAKITPEAAPTKEGYSFSGWSSIPETMPAKDVVVSGTFTKGAYKLTYMVDGEVYKTVSYDFGATITPEAAPTKEGYTFSGWSEIPQTMPAKDVTVTGTFTINMYKLTYMVDGAEYKSYDIEYGAKITPEAEPTKEGYSFSGWSSIPETMPAKDVVVTGTFSKGAYKLTYMVDGQVYKTVSYDFGATITPEAAPTKEGYTFSGWSTIPATMPAKDVTVTGTFTINKYKLTYMVDGAEYKSYDIEYGAKITPEAEPTKEGYSFSGWSSIPETMPAKDVVVTGTFTKGAYKLTYMVDGEVYKTVSYDFGATITPEAAPTKEGYTFSGWSEIPQTMPAKDVTVTGTFTINKYKLTYMVDDVEYKSYQIEYGAKITPEAEPTKEGYSFSGWSSIPETMPAKDVVVTGSFSKGAYKLTYMVDGEVYKTVSYDYDATITPEAAPTKEGYTFSGWSEIPQTMPAKDVTVTGTFTINKYKLTYMVDDVEYKSYQIEYGAKITPEAEPTKEGYSFSGWSSIPETMPAKDVVVTGSFSKGAYKLTYMVDGQVYKTVSYDYGATITPEAAPTKKGYTFSGWSEIPQTMPAKDVTVTGTFTINKYKLTYMVDGAEYRSYDVEYGAIITPEATPTKEGYTFSGWSDIPQTMPARDVVVTGTFIQNEQTTGFTIDDVTYDITGEGTVTITGSEQAGEATIDATVVINGQTYRVTAIADNAFKENQSITSVTIPEGITTIGDNAFNGCINLIVINIGKDVQSIGNKAFANVGTASAARTRSEESMLIVNCYAESVPQTASDAFENTPIENGTLMVEDNSVNAYKATSPWSRFGRILGFDEAAGINTISVDSANARIYDMQGNRLDNPQKGVNIIRYKDGKVKKVMVK